MKEKIYIGWGETDITPRKKINLAGQFFERISEYVETPLSATAMYIKCGGESVVICSCDLVHITPELISRVKTILIGTGVDTEKMIICATHTHTSYLYYEENSGITLHLLDKYLGKENEPEARDDVMTPSEALDFISHGVAEAIKKSYDDLTDAYIANGFGRAVVGHCRRVVYDGGSAKMYGDSECASFEGLEGSSDSGIELLYTFDSEKKLRGIVVNVACPSQVLEHRRFVSSDYWGKVRQLLRDKYGSDLFILGLCGAAGDQSPRDMIRWVEPESPTGDPNITRERPTPRRADVSMFDIEGSWTLGRRICAAVAEAYPCESELRGCVSLSHMKREVGFPVRKVTPDEYEAAKNQLESFVRPKEGITYHDRARLHLCCGTMARFEQQQKTTLYNNEIHVFALDGIVFATNPFELFLDFGNKIKARSSAEQTFLIQLASGSGGYLPTAKAERGGHYSAYVSSGITGHEGGELLVGTTLDMIYSLIG